MMMEKLKPAPAQTVPGAKLTEIVPRWHLVAIALLLCAMLAQGISNIMAMSVTWDEAMYIGIGNYILRTGHIDFKHIDGLHFHPVYSFYLNSLLLLFLKLPPQTLQIPADGLYTFTAARELLFHSGYSPELILFLIRLPILLQTLLLGGFVYAFAKKLFGANAGLLALALIAFDPNILAHSAIACTDSSITCWILASTYFYYEYLTAPSRKWLWLTGAAVGLACLSKVSAPFLLAVVFPCMYLASRFQAGTLSLKSLLPVKWQLERKSGQHLIFVALIAALMIWGAYGFGLSINYKTASEIQASGVTGAKAMMQSNNFIRLPLAPYINVVAFVTTAAVGIPRHAYLLGQNSADGFRYYSFVTMLLKTPLAVLLLLLATIVGWKKLPRAGLTAETGLAVACLFQLFCALFEHANCGIRYILPIYPLLYVWISRLAPRSFDNFSTNKRLAVQALLILFVSLNAIESVSACPNQIAYFNTFFNNPATKYHYIVDSNLDWGNELYDLRNYMREQQIPEVSLQYFGNVDPKDYGINWKAADRNSKGWVAISATNLAGAYLEEDEFAEFRKMQPRAVLSGGGMFIFYR
ncbi:MAG TPA: glycosyltransferase family 39 protein [Drouetiella sp.]|jgi:4-amino-4-deoxy-L-arabinose transferase-like glycosyltransferase